MAIILGKVKCYFCGEKKGFMHSVHKYGEYGAVGGRHFYHPECLSRIQADPMKFSHIMADKAIHIQDLKESNLSSNEALVKEYNEKINELHKAHFEEIMPSGGK